MTPDTAVPAAKRALRALMKERLAAVAPALRASSGEVVAAHLRSRVSSLPAGARVACFASLPIELQTAALDDLLRASSVTRVYPRVAGPRLVFHELPPGLAAAQMSKGNFRVPTPLADWPIVELNSCDLVIVPGVAFDLAGGRLGWGRGFYDRALREGQLVGDARVVAIALDVQIVDEVPADEHDVVLPALVTPTRGWVSISSASAIRPP